MGYCKSGSLESKACDMRAVMVVMVDEGRRQEGGRASYVNLSLDLLSWGFLLVALFLNYIFYWL
jgi:hypothetical protein